MVPTPRQFVLLLGGCLVLGVGVGLLLTADLGSDGYSTMLYGITRASGLSFLAVSVIVGVLFLLMAFARGIRPGIGTVAQLLVVGGTVPVAMNVLPAPESIVGQALMLIVALPVLALGIAAYLGSHTGAGPTEAAAQAWDPPVPFRWSYSIVQLGGAVLGWACGATIGVGTLAVIVLLGPAVSWAGRLLRVDVHGERRDSPTG